MTLRPETPAATRLRHRRNALEHINAYTATARALGATDEPAGCFDGTSGSASTPSVISFSARPDGKPQLQLCADGTFEVDGRKVADDIEVYNAMAAFLRQVGVLP